MDNYNEYITKLKKHQELPDYQKMYSRIQGKTHKKHRVFALPKMGLAFAAALCAVIFVFTIYFSAFGPYYSDQGGTLSYVMGSEEHGMNPILDYVFQN